MSPTAASFTASLADAVAVVASLAARSLEIRELDDTEVMQTQRVLATVKSHVDSMSSVAAGELVARSSAVNGLSGLARRTGFRTPQALVQDLTGATSREANTLVKVGAMLNESNSTIDSAATPTREPWLAAAGTAVQNGTLTIAGANAIRTGLGTPGPGVSADDLSTAVDELLDTIARHAALASDAIDPSDGTNLSNEAALPDGADGADSADAAYATDADLHLNAHLPHADDILRMARDARDRLDENGIRERERARRQLRSFRRWAKPDGMTRYTWELDPEGAALIDGIYDQLTSPRRGGPRFINDTDRARAEQLEHDPRTVEQLASDGFLDLLHIAVDTAPTAVLGTTRPAVQVLVTADTLARAHNARAAGIEPRGHGRLQGHNTPVSLDTVERHLCNTGTLGIIFDTHSQPLHVGREKRLFTRAQRIALAARDGGCRWPSCERPPTWTEAHHLTPWSEGGRSDIDNGASSEYDPSGLAVILVS